MSFTESLAIFGSEENDGFVQRKRRTLFIDIS